MNDPRCGRTTSHGGLCQSGPVIHPPNTRSKDGVTELVTPTVQQQRAATANGPTKTQTADRSENSLDLSQIPADPQYSLRRGSNNGVVPGTRSRGIMAHAHEDVEVSISVSAEYEVDLTLSL